MLPSLSESFNCIQKIRLSLFVTVNNGLSRILRENLVLDYKLMKVISQEICASVATMTIEDAKERALGPIHYVFFCGWLHNVQDNTNSVLVVITDNSLICVGCVPHDVSVFSHTALGRLPAWQIQRGWIWRWAIPKKQLLDIQRLVCFLRLCSIRLISVRGNSFR